MCTGFWWGNLSERVHWGDLDVDGKKILRRIFGKWEWLEIGWSWLRLGRVAGACEHGDEPSGFVSCGEFLD